MLIGALVLASPTASGMSFLTAYRLAWQNDPTFAAARAAYDAAREQAPEARARLLPHLAVTGSDDWTRAETAFQDPIYGPSQVNRSVGAWTWNLQLSQPMVAIPQIFRYEQSQALVAKAAALYARAKEHLILRVARAYFRVLVAVRTVRAARAQVRAMTAQWRLARHGFAKGIDTVTDVEEAQAQLARAQAQLVGAQNTKTNAAAQLKQMIGVPLTPDLRALSAGLVLPKPAPENRLAWMHKAEQEAPVVRAAQAALKAAHKRVDGAFARYAPRVDVVASYGQNASSGSLTTPDNYSLRARSWEAGVQVDVPIFMGGGTYAYATQAQAYARQAIAELRAASRHAQLQALEAYEGVMAGRSQVVALMLAVRSGRKAVRGARKGYRAGIGTNLDVLTVERDLYKDERALASSQYRTLLEGLRLKASVGRLTRADVLAIDKMLIEPVRLSR
jgi:outer membrane protein